MEFKELIAKRRSVRKFSDRPVPREVVDRILAEALTAPSARNTRTSRLLVIDDPALVARMADMRDYGSGFLTGAPLAIVVLGDTSSSDLWRENAAITATVVQLACVDEGLASCWVHVNGRPRRKDAPDGETAADYLRQFLPIPNGCEPLCAIAAGYSDFTPASSAAGSGADHPAEITARNRKSPSERGRFSVPAYRGQCASSQLPPMPASAISRTLSCAADSMHSVTIFVTRSCSERSISTTNSSCTCKITRERMPSAAKRR